MNPVMMVGPVGTGKTSVAQEVLNSLDPKNYSVLTINMSAQVSLFALPYHNHLLNGRNIFE